MPLRLVQWGYHRRRPGGRWWWLAGLIGLGLLATSLVGDEAGPKPSSEEEGARLVLNRWIEAMGGPYELAALRTADYLCEISFGNNTPPIPVYLRATADGRYRYDYTLPTYGLLIQAYDGTSAWQQNDTLGFGPLSEGEHFENRTGTDFREPMSVGRRYPHRKRLPDESVDGRNLQVVEMGTKDGWKPKWYFDPETGLRVRIEATVGESKMVIEYSDFRWFQRVREPYRIVRKTQGSTMMIVRKSILYNEPSEHMLFMPPGSRISDHNEMEGMLRDNDSIMGNHNLRDIETVVVKAVTMNTSSGVKITSTTYKKRPNLMVRQQESPGMGVEWQGFDGKIGWVSNELQGFRTMQGAELAQMRASADLDEPLRLRRMSTLRRPLGEIIENGRALMGIAMATVQGPVGNFYYDKKTSYLVRLETFVQAGPSGQLGVVADFSDYRQVGGIKMPFTTVFTNPAMQLVTKIESVEQNVPLDDALFQPKKEL
jgi:hypothetical protein